MGTDFCDSWFYSQDVSYLRCIELCGVQSEILGGLACLTSPKLGLTFAATSLLSGNREGLSRLRIEWYWQSSVNRKLLTRCRSKVDCSCTARASIRAASSAPSPSCGATAKRRTPRTAGRCGCGATPPSTTSWRPSCDRRWARPCGWRASAADNSRWIASGCAVRSRTKSSALCWRNRCDRRWPAGGWLRPSYWPPPSSGISLLISHVVLL